MKVSFWASRHVRSILFLLIVLIAGGVLGTLSLPVSLFPHVSFPRIRLNFDAGDRPAERMMIQVTRPVEEALRGIPGVREIHSTTSRGGSEIALSFDWGADMATAYLQSQGEIARLLPTLPAGTTFEIRRMDPTVFPVIAYSLTSATHKVSELRDLAQYQIRPILSTVPGVTKIGVEGGSVEEYHVTLDPAKLAAHSLALTDVTSALSAASVLTAVGKIEDRFRLYLVVTNTQFQSIDEIGKTVLRSGNGGVTLLAEVASITDAQEPQYTRSTSDGRECVLLNVYQQPGGNTVEIARGIRDAFAGARKNLPGDVNIACWYDQSDLITSSATGVRDAVVIGVVLAALILLLFLRNWRMTLIAIISVPVVLAITALVLYALGQSFNIMTLGGMAAAVGLIIDDAIVVSEHIVRRLHHHRGSVDETVLNAANEFSKPLTGSSLSTIVIHIPPIFLVGLFGAFFAALSLSMATSLVISFAVAWLVIPVLAVQLLKHVPEPPETGRIARAADRFYTATMSRVLARPWLALLLVVPLCIAGYFAFTHVASGVIPTIDEGGFVIDYIGPSGASVNEMDRLLGKVEKKLQEMPEVLSYSRRTGFDLGNDMSEANNGDFFVRLKPLPRRPIKEVMDEISDYVSNNVPGFDKFEPAQLMEDLLGDLTGKPEPVVINLFCDDQAVLQDLAPKVVDGLKSIKGIPPDDIDAGITPAGDAIEVKVDRVKASLEGMDPDSLSSALNDLLAGSVTTQIQQGEKVIGVRVWTPPSIRKTTNDLAALQLRAPDGHLFPLGRVASFNLLPGQAELNREDLKRVVSVTARSDRDLGSTIEDVRAMLDKPGMIPPGVTYTLGGQYEQQRIAFRGAIAVIFAGAALVFLLLLVMYERLRVAGAILLLSVLAVASVFIGLWCTGSELNISSLMGMVMIVGNVTEVAIFYYSEYVSDTSGEFHGRLIAAGNQRMRAITMTTTAAILALLPLALGIGHSAGMLQPLAIAIITGLIVQLPLVLIVLPAMLVMGDSGK